MQNLERINNNLWFTFIARVSMAMAVPMGTVLWYLGVTILNERFDALHGDLSSVAVRLSTAETQVAAHATELQAHEFKIEGIEKALDANLPVLSATAGKLARDEDRLDSMASAMADIRHTSEAISDKLTALSLQLTSIEARLPSSHQGSVQGDSQQ